MTASMDSTSNRSGADGDADGDRRTTGTFCKVPVEGDIAVPAPEMKEAARQQGGFLLRENSSNGGKPSELSGAIVWFAPKCVKANSERQQLFDNLQLPGYLLDHSHRVGYSPYLRFYA